MASDDGSNDGIKTVYEEICRRHDGIEQFRAQLLGLLPIASAGGIFLLLRLEHSAKGGVPPFLLPAGILGALFALGLFIYELRGIHKCHVLIRGAEVLERGLLGTKLWDKGPFTSDPKELWKGFVGETGAALIIYPAVIGGWVFVAGVGRSGELDWGAAGLGLVFGIFALALGVLVRKRQKQKPDDDKGERNWPANEGAA
jgi:hypothetical protein